MDIFDAVSFELFNLGPSGALIRNNLSNVGPIFVEAGLRTFPMLSSYPHPPEFLDWMRQLWQEPQVGSHFIDQCVNSARLHNFSGLNVDFEPTTNATAADARGYAFFLQKFASAMSASGLELNVDVANWSAIWDYNTLGSACPSVTSFITMGTYADALSSFYHQFDLAATAFALPQLGIGLASVNLTDSQPFRPSDLQPRFDKIVQAKVPTLGIWDMPLDMDLWGSYLKMYCQSGVHER